MKNYIHAKRYAEGSRDEATHAGMLSWLQAYVASRDLAAANRPEPSDDPKLVKQREKQRKWRERQASKI